MSEDWRGWRVAQERVVDRAYSQLINPYRDCVFRCFIRWSLLLLHVLCMMALHDREDTFLIVGPERERGDSARSRAA